MIDGMLLAGFKGFPFVWDYLKLRPITLIFGANGAGKSSILQAMAWMHHLHCGGKVDAHRLRLTGNHITLGGFSQFRMRTDPSPLYGALQDEDAIGLGFGFRMGDPIRTPQGLPGRYPFFGLDVPGWCLTYEINPNGVSIVRIFCGPLAIVWEREGSSFKHAGFWAATDASDSQRGDDSSWDLERMHPEDIHQCLSGMFGDKFQPNELPENWYESFNDWVGKSLRAATFCLDGMAPSLRFKTRNNPSAPLWGCEFLSILDAAVVQMQRDVKEYFAEMAYLGPWRRIPTASDLAGNFGDEEEIELSLWQLLKDDKELRDALNSWLHEIGSSLQVTPRDLVNRERILTQIQELFTQYASVPDWQIEEGKAHALDLELILQAVNSIPSDELGLILRMSPSMEEISPFQTGVGISQVVPVILAALSRHRRRWLIEQPELHLHPQAQARLGDLLINGAIANTGPRHWFIVETHSEHLILRILRRIRETTQMFDKNIYRINSDDLAIAHLGQYTGVKGMLSREGIRDGFSPIVQADGFVVSSEMLIGLDPEGYKKNLVGATRITNIPVTPDGDFGIKWPGGFFEERLDELFSDDERNSWMRS